MEDGPWQRGQHMSGPTTDIEIPAPVVQWEKAPLDHENPPHPPAPARRHVAVDRKPLPDIVEGVCSSCGADITGPEDASCCGSRILDIPAEVDDLRDIRL